MIPGVLIGKKRGVLVQFFCTLVLSLMALSFADFLGLIFGSQTVEQVLSYAVMLTNPWIAGFYLSLSYILMLTVDLYNKKKTNKRRNRTFDGGTLKKPKSRNKILKQGHAPSQHNLHTNPQILDKLFFELLEHSIFSIRPQFECCTQ